jgi:hypothetical protein
VVVLAFPSHLHETSFWGEAEVWGCPAISLLLTPTQGWISDPLHLLTSSCSSILSVGYKHPTQLRTHPLPVKISFSSLTQWDRVPTPESHLHPISTCLFLPKPATYSSQFSKQTVSPLQKWLPYKFLNPLHSQGDPSTRPALDCNKTSCSKLWGGYKTSHLPHASPVKLG